MIVYPNYILYSTECAFAIFMIYRGYQRQQCVHFPELCMYFMVLLTLFSSYQRRIPISKPKGGDFYLGNPTSICMLLFDSLICFVIGRQEIYSEFVPIKL